MDQKTNQQNGQTNKGDPDPNAAVVEERIIKVTGDVQIRKYYKGR